MILQIRFESNPCSPPWKTCSCRPPGWREPSEETKRDGRTEFDLGSALWIRIVGWRVEPSLKTIRNRNCYVIFINLFCVCAFGNSGGARNCCRISKIVRLAPPAVACRVAVLAVVGCLEINYFLLGFLHGNRPAWLRRQFFNETRVTSLTRVLFGYFNIGRTLMAIPRSIPIHFILNLIGQ